MKLETLNYHQGTYTPLWGVRDLLRTYPALVIAYSSEFFEIFS
jgi:hypothetical protein